MSLTEIISPFFPTFPSKKSPPSKNLALLADAFEGSLLRHIETLISTVSAGDSPSLGLSWLSKAVDVLSSVHVDAGTLVSDPSVSGSDASLNSYLDESVKLLDFCNLITAEIGSLDRRLLLIRFAVHLLSSGAGGEKLRRARDSIDEWEKKSSPIHPSDLAPRGKARKPVHRAIYATGAVSALIASSLSAALGGELSEELRKVAVSGEYPWVDAFRCLESAIGGEKRRSVGEVVRLDIAVRALADVIDKVGETETDVLTNAVSDVGRATKEMTDGLERLTNAVNGLFRSVLVSRNLVLQKFRLCPQKCK
ncbi:hypothetical protein QJS04_geneDACA019147 [Acorus gramineus]|uniref:Uncharacterized protein n=1 Tax=Acorus gramineus TaxID=55184 RepID=A0AAV9BCT3_ACOGR|nr:hypothetical protein QJS04_geneDACA019147 [Acorus gramineus]